ncbi:CAAX prenyl protease 1 [Nowakowskiella sp. JEL0407]|nr:CAAX prenyl protease 1 [Nowakowskiella sp. JEL0407]
MQSFLLKSSKKPFLPASVASFTRPLITATFLRAPQLFRLTEQIDPALTTSLSDRDPRFTVQDEKSDSQRFAHETSESLKRRNSDLDSHLYKHQVVVRRLFDKYLASKFRCDPHQVQAQFAYELLRAISSDVLAREAIIIPLLSEVAVSHVINDTQQNKILECKEDIQKTLDYMKYVLDDLEEIDPQDESFDEELKRVVMIFEENLQGVTHIRDLHPEQCAQAGEKFSEIKKLVVEHLKAKVQLRKSQVLFAKRSNASDHNKVNVPNVFAQRVNPPAPQLQKMNSITHYKEAVLGFSYAIFIWENYLRKFGETSVPKLLKEVVPGEDFTKAQEYGRAKSKFGFVSGAFSQLQTTIIFLFDLIPYFWSVSDLLLDRFGVQKNEIITSLLFVVIISVLSTLINIPFSLYYTFVLEEKFGFNKQTIGLFFVDMIKSLAISLIIGLPVLAGFLKIIQTFSNFFLYIWLFMLAFQFVMTLIFPTVIQPLFNTFTPLKEGELKEKIVELAKSIKFPLTKIFVIDGSKRSSHSNAYFFGFWKIKRIVLFDTLLEQANDDEILAVLAHELGHWSYNHVFKTLAVSQVHLFVVFYLFSLFIHDTQLYKSFGFSEQPILIGFLLFQFIYSPVESVMGFLMNILSRKHEFEADSFAKSLGYSKFLKSGLVKLHLKNLGSMNPDKLYSAYHYSHPPLIERLEALEDPLVSQKKVD